jgi:hypothetical protein
MRMVPLSRFTSSQVSPSASPWRRPSASASAHRAPLRRLGCGAPIDRPTGRRVRLRRVFVPSLVIDHTELVLRRTGVQGHEGFALWAGTLAGGDAYVATLVVPRATTDAWHGQITPETTAAVLTALDERDLVPVVQLHSHPRRAFLSETDAIRPLVAVPGFISVVIPDFGFVDLADVGPWSAHEYVSHGQWRELGRRERARRFIIDDSVIRVD